MLVRKMRQSIESSTRLRDCQCVQASIGHNILHSPAEEGKKSSSTDKTIHIITRVAQGPSGALTRTEDIIAEVLVFVILLSHERAHLAVWFHTPLIGSIY